MHGVGVHHGHFCAVFQRVLLGEFLTQGGILPEHGDLVRRHRVRQFRRLGAFVRTGGVLIRRQRRHRQKLEEKYKGE